MNELRLLLRDASLRLSHAGVGSPDTDAIALLAHAWSTDVAEVRRAEVLGRMPDDVVLQRFSALIDERATRVPLQHLTGRAAFRHLELAVGPGVFVPRPETEMLVDLVAPTLQSIAAPVVVDLCAGSGALALAVKNEHPAASVYAAELSPDACAWAQANRDRLGLDVRIRCEDALTAFPELEGQVDVVLSNPPYIPVGMVPIDPEVRDHDPQIALYGGSEDGLRIPLLVAARAAQLLRPGGLLVMEHASSQGDSLPARLSIQGLWDDVADHRDLTALPRAVSAHCR
ncbi:peptide chain release factor N(5)-glutamine methyltransferase [Allobranchiibius sp. GilTou73]|uniref:peptide chain release factor N(5)-glutamine methyltransferase n=1 Tax=Allobranchiibius sp. GilTou73 TaxID=2904523 RepID=UPI001F2793D6|nr:peptide chain release factor N(5)-glutamine methyltransferase [Allobranchiibius sp. GilTou73]UIJ36390.1 peptide chain release factor N(5)-glutamine methyltransferase [Allobranchiibius sp. GilTou73]